MSADRWSPCPKCRAKRRDELNDRRERLEGAYGHATQEEYERELSALRAAEAVHENNTDPTLREDWSLCRVEGSTELLLDYGAACRVCDYRHEVRITSPGPEVA